MNTMGASLRAAESFVLSPALTVREIWKRRTYEGDCDTALLVAMVGVDVAAELLGGNCFASAPSCTF